MPKPCRTPHRPVQDTTLACLIVSDEHNVHYLEEQHLDAWWLSLDLDLKCEIYEAALEGDTYAVEHPELAQVAERLDTFTLPQLAEVTREAERAQACMLALAAKAVPDA